MPEFTSFIPADLEIKKWDDIKPYFDVLREARPRTLASLKRLIRHYSDVLSVFCENDVLVDIAYSQDMSKRRAKHRYDTFLEDISPEYERTTNAIDRNIVRNTSFRDLCYEPGYRQMYRLFKQWTEGQREENIPLEIEIQKISDRCEEILSTIEVPIDGQKLSLEEAQDAMKVDDREKREAIWLAMERERMRVKEIFDEYFHTMTQWRHKAGRRAGHRNYRKYKHYGYYPQHRIKDAARFHEAIRQYVVPLAEKITRRHRHRLGLQGKLLRPWDTDGSGFVGVPLGEEGARPFQDHNDLRRKTMHVFGALHPEFADNLRLMHKKGLLDIESRRNKALGAYTQSLEIQGLPYISMHAGTTYQDFMTLLHEGGHAMHIFAMNNEPYFFHRFTPLDDTTAETFSMGMELITGPLWEEHIDLEAARRARREQLEEVIRFLPWCAIIDKFQQEIYEHPQLSPKERDACFAKLMDTFYPSEINWRGLEKYRKNYWQEQSHIISTPFYYIQYGFAQLAAVDLYKHFKEDPAGKTRAYIKGMRMGAKEPYPKIWKEMGIDLNFSTRGIRRSLERIPELMGFVMNELDELDD